MLGFIGLTEGEEAAYRALVQLGPGTCHDIARHLGAGDEQTAGWLRSLEARGMAAEQGGEPGRYVAAPPQLAFGGPLAEHRHALEQAEATVAALTEDFRLAAARHVHADLVEILTGVGAIGHRFEQIQRGARHELLALVTSAPMAVTGEQNQAEEGAVARGVSYRVVIEQAVLEQPATLGELSSALARSQQVRVVPRVPSKLVVADRSVALVPFLPAVEADRIQQATALVVRAGGLVEALVGFFEGVWATARPLLLSPTGEVQEEPQTEGPDDTDLLIVSLMLTGLTDRTIAGRLGLSLRTMQRRVQRLMELAGVTSRMQLGWHAYEQGWVQR